MRAAGGPRRADRERADQGRRGRLQRCRRAARRHTQLAHRRPRRAGHRRHLVRASRARSSPACGAQALADRILAEHGRGTDDALVVVVRSGARVTRLRDPAARPTSRGRDAGGPRELAAGCRPLRGGGAARRHRGLGGRHQRLAATRGGGEVELAPLERERPRAACACVVARPRARASRDVAAALRDGVSSGGSLGVGLPGARRLMDEFELRSARRRAARSSDGEVGRAAARATRARWSLPGARAARSRSRSASATACCSARRRARTPSEAARACARRRRGARRPRLVGACHGLHPPGGRSASRWRR